MGLFTKTTLKSIVLGLGIELSGRVLGMGEVLGLFPSTTEKVKKVSMLLLRRLSCSSFPCIMVNCLIISPSGLTLREIIKSMTGRK